jgi:lysophospholipase L1-like esterase
MIPLYIFIPIVVILLISEVLVYFYAKKKGADDFMQLIFMAGLIGKQDAFKNYNRYSKPNGIVFVGDSITQDFNVYEYFPDQNVYNRGIGGDTSKGVLRRLDVSVFELKPSQVFLQIGTNDLELLNDGVEGVFNRTKEIIQKIKSFDEKIKINLVSVYPVNKAIDPKTVGKRSNEDIKALNQKLKTIDGVMYIDLYSKLVKDDALNPAYTLEGLHLNQQGYEVLIKTFKQYI